MSGSRPTIRIGAVDYLAACPMLWLGASNSRRPGSVAGNMRGMPMSSMSSPAQPEFYAGLLPVEPSAEPPPARPPDLESDQFPYGPPSLRKRASRALSRCLITFCIGVSATLTWQSYGDAARDAIANSYSQLGWLAAQAGSVAQKAPDT